MQNLTKKPLTFPPILSFQGSVIFSIEWHRHHPKNYHRTCSTPHSSFLGHFLTLIRAPLPSWILRTIGTLFCKCIRHAFHLCCRWREPVRLCPMIICSVVHNRHAFCPAILTRLRVDEHQRISTDILVRHHSVTFALVLNQRFFTWAKRCPARARQERRSFLAGFQWMR